jgi:hypothetical protein
LLAKELSQDIQKDASVVQQIKQFMFTDEEMAIVDPEPLIVIKPTKRTTKAKAKIAAVPPPKPAAVPAAVPPASSGSSLAAALSHLKDGLGLGAIGVGI